MERAKGNASPEDQPSTPDQPYVGYGYSHNTDHLSDEERKAGFAAFAQRRLGIDLNKPAGRAMFEKMWAAGQARRKARLEGNPIEQVFTVTRTPEEIKASFMPKKPVSSSRHKTRHKKRKK